VIPQQAFLDVASNIGFFSADPDSDGTMRRLPLVYRFGDAFVPSLALAAASLHFGSSPALLADPNYRDGLMRVGFPAESGRITEVPVDPSGALRINYYGPSEARDEDDVDHGGIFPRVSLSDIEANTFDPKLVKGKIVLVAVTAIGTFDQRVTPFSPIVPGTEIHAAAIQNMISGSALDRPELHLQIEMLLALLLATFLGIVLPRLSVTTAVSVVVAMMATWALVDFFVLFRSNLFFAQVPLQLQLGLTWAGVTVWGYLTEGREKTRLKREFSTVLAPTVVEELLKNPALAGLGGTERELTVMFSDIRGFTTMSEKLSPEGLTQFLNEYLTPMTEILIQRQGTLDKYMGDAIMAFWGAPIEQADHAARASLAALDMLEKLDELRVKWQAEGKPSIDIGIGLNSGLMRVGFMGSERMRNYTLLGDNVNLGSRLEGTNKNYGTHIIVSEVTYRATKGAVHGRLLDAVKVKGKLEPVRIYELVGKGAPSAATAAWIARFEEGFGLYQKKRFDEAEVCFHDVKAARGEDPASDLYLERCEHFRAEPPPEDWDGVYEFKTK
jgi:adenylate cyclase